jgi:hypothetical protein
VSLLMRYGEELECLVCDWKFRIYTPSSTISFSSPDFGIEALLTGI